MCTEMGVVSTHALPVLHRPVDALGGGSAWMAGLLDAFMAKGCLLLSSTVVSFLFD